MIRRQVDGWLSMCPLVHMTVSDCALSISFPSIREITEYLLGRGSFLCGVWLSLRRFLVYIVAATWHRTQYASEAGGLMRRGYPRTCMTWVLRESRLQLTLAKTSLGPS